MGRGPEQGYRRCSADFTKGDVTRDDSQRRFLAQHSVVMLEQCYNYSKQCCNAVLQWKSSLKLSSVTSPQPGLDYVCDAGYRVGPLFVTKSPLAGNSIMHKTKGVIKKTNQTFFLPLGLWTPWTCAPPSVPFVWILCILCGLHLAALVWLLFIKLVLYSLGMLNVITKRQLTWCLRNNFDHGDFSRFLVDFMIH